MARDIRINLIGNASSVNAMLSSVEGRMDQLTRTGIRSIAAGQLTLFGNNANPFDSTAAGKTQAYISKVTAAYDTYANTVKYVTTVTRDLDGVGAHLVTTQERWAGNVREITRLQDVMNASTNEAIALNERFNASRALVQPIIAQNQAIVSNIGAQRLQASNAVSSAQQRLGNLQAAYTGALASGDTVRAIRISTLIPRADAILQQRIQEQAQVFANTTPLLAAAQRDLISATERDAMLVNNQDILTATAFTRAKALERQLTAARTAPPVATPALATIATQSPQTARVLARAGLGAGATSLATLGSTMAAQGAFESFQIEEDLVRQVTRVTGSFRDQHGVLKGINLEYDKSGNIITRFGARMSGLGTVLGQLGRDFQKVFEFAIATTAIFGAFNVVRQSITTINELDKSLRQFAITSQVSRQEAKSLFNDLANVAYTTATPLKEVVKAADDIALATRKAGQSSEDWQKSTVELTNAVGILTNLAGIDTVRATDLLTSSMKQLGLTSSEVVGVLNKVTAVAGGQSASIADIVTSLGTLAEAGKQAGLSLDELIGLSQVLSQVTPKSPAEIATSVKNLIGSLQSPGSKKVLEEFGIDLKATEAGVVRARNIIEIYTEIAQKIRTGIIPPDRVQDVLRGIAGGPRRQPDAAALLSNITTIERVAERSSRATNEAIIANAKLLDSTIAKMTQLGVVFDKFAFGKFADALNQAAGTVITALEGILKLLDMLPTGVYTFIIQITGMFVVFKGLSVILGLVKNTVLGLAETLGLAGGQSLFASNAARNLYKTYLDLSATSTTAEQREIALTAAMKLNEIETLRLAAATGTLTTARAGAAAAGAAGVIPPGIAPGVGPGEGILGAAAAGATANTAINALTTSSIGSKIGAILKSPVGKVAGPLAFIGAATGISGLLTSGSQNQTQDMANILSTLGIAASILVPPLRIAGLALTGLSLGMTLFSDTTKKATESTASNTEGLLLAIQAYQEAQNTLTGPSGLVKIQEELDAKIKKLEGTSNKTAEQTSALSSAYREYAVNAVEVGKANTQIAESLKNIADLAPQVQEALKQFSLPTLNASNLNPADLDAYTQRLAAIIYEKTNPQFVAPETIQFPILKPPTPINFSGVRRQDAPFPAINPAFSGMEKDLSELKSKREITLFDVKSLENDTTKIKNLFDETGKQMVASFEPSAYNIQTVYNALNDVNNGLTGVVGQEDKLRNMKILFQEWAAAANLVAGAQLSIASNQAYLTTAGITGALTPSAVDEGNKRLELFKKVISGSGNFAPTRFTEERGREIPIAGSGGEDAILKVYKQLFDEQGKLKTVGKELIPINREQAIALADILIAAQGLDISTASATQKLEQEKQAFADLGIYVPKFNEDLQQAAENSDYLKQRTESLANALENMQQTYANAARELLAKKLGGDTTADTQREIAANDARRKSFEDLQKVFDTISEESLLKLEDKLASSQYFLDATGKDAGSLATYLITVASQMGMTASQTDNFTKAIITLNAALNATTNTPYTITLGFNVLRRTGELEGNGNYTTPTIVQPNPDYIDPNKAWEDFIKKFFAASGSPFSGGGGGPSTSTLYLSDEQRKQADPLALVKKSYQDALRMQAQIPGEAAKNKGDIVVVFDGLKKIFTALNVSEELLRKAIEENTKTLLINTKPDAIQRIRVGQGSFAALANVPFNTKTGVSVGGPTQPITVNVNVNGQILTMAQLDQIANKVAAAWGASQVGG